ncbi:MAG: hypothetical protein H0U18_04665 [Pyrinomonadaceae bacterium]|nr:hypothetical protein [Pyrinomonadaceae bacterium]
MATANGSVVECHDMTVTLTATNYGFTRRNGDMTPPKKVNLRHDLVMK